MLRDMEPISDVRRQYLDLYLTYDSNGTLDLSGITQFTESTKMSSEVLERRLRGF
ncbi:hypothetical protein FOYG_07787 [Fusarium oxysporum NRRL 32931]|uniref:Uncharacterized protein n=1 Tax=Fusarium oxysporum NRRL 32931 TaxID=660029 RepID=W9I6B4_FUSOX|nr:hypothetical protein FOYG_07787 [Fusarium oxysporum NRRL 32931]EWY90182.1 hypothetical protein FOYG_07787 [Fusarium oxysporum NRRL 32931]